MEAKKSTDRKKEGPRIKHRTALQLVLFSICTIGAMDFVARKSIKQIVKAPGHMANLSGVTWGELGNPHLADCWKVDLS